MDSDGDAVDEAPETVAVESAAPSRPPLRRALLVGSAIVLALAGLCAGLGRQAYQGHKAAQGRAMLVAAAERTATNLTTVSYAHAEADVQRILDSVTGGFYDDFQARSAPFIDVVRKAESKSEGTVTEAGLESVDGDSGRVLVAVTVTTETGGRPDARPRYWRMRLTVDRQGDQAKVSKVDFVP